MSAGVGRGAGEGTLRAGLGGGVLVSGAHRGRAEAVREGLREDSAAADL